MAAYFKEEIKVEDFEMKEVKAIKEEIFPSSGEEDEYTLLIKEDDVKLEITELNGKIKT